MQLNLDKGLLYQLSKHGLELFILCIHVFRLSCSMPSVSPSPLIRAKVLMIKGLK
jgi:hypothetical protein